MHGIEQAFDLFHETVLPVVGGPQGFEEHCAGGASEQLGVFGTQGFGADPLVAALADVTVGSQGNGQGVVDQADSRQALQASGGRHQ
ncbi:hypothetical protein D3C73_1184090 [compost metagenome]